jgi:xylan 1,4-beta-xylosidase
MWSAMNRLRSVCLAAAACLGAAAYLGGLGSAYAQPKVTFDWFEYTGRDAVFEKDAPAGSYRNPILAGFYPDPSITRAGDKFYLVNSTFAYFPGIPIFESDDLVHWRQIGHVIDRPSQLRFDGLGISRGVFAPTIEYHDGTFYVLNTAVDSGGNFIVTSKDPKGPWSDPVWLPEIDGIDPSLFIDKDGRAYILNNGPPPGVPQYDGHRAIWIQEFSIAKMRLVGPRRVLVDGGVDPSTQPIWIEGPHLYLVDGWYYLVCAEGGTGPNHSQVVLRGRSPWGPFEPYRDNPILTQRDLPEERPEPITNAGHADLVQAPDGTWWATFLATRTYDRVHYNTGRETFLLPVEWRDGWPVILDKGRTIPYVAKAPAFARGERQAPLSGNFTWRDEFDQPALDFAWLQVHVPKQPWYDLKSTPGVLTMTPLAVNLAEKTNSSFLARRQQHQRFDASTALILPKTGKVAAGMAAYQSEDYWYFLGSRRKGRDIEVFLEKKGGKPAETIASTVVSGKGELKLKITGEERAYSFYYDADGKGWRSLFENDDGSILSTEVAGGFVGAVVGMHARIEGAARDTD